MEQNDDRSGIARGTPPALFALAAFAFCIGTGEFVVPGLLLNIARNLNVSTGNAGLLISAYAGGVVLGAPLMGILLRKLAHKTALSVLVTLLMIGNLLCASAPNFKVLIVGRAVTGLAHAALFGLGSIVAAEIAPRGKQASSIAFMFHGVTLAALIGVPLGALLAESFGWRAVFWTISGLSAVALAAILALLPAAHREERSASVSSVLKEVTSTGVLLAFAITVFANGSVVTVLTFIEPLLVKTAGFREHTMSALLLVLGLGFVVGNVIGGKLADQRLIPALLSTIGGLAAILAVLALAIHSRSTAVAAVFGFGVAAFAIVAPLQAQVVAKVRHPSPLLSILNIAAFNVGTAGGAFLGRRVLIGHLGLTFIPWAGSIAALAGFLLVLLSSTLDESKVEVNASPV